MNFTERKNKVWSLRYTPGNSKVDDAINAIIDETGVSAVSAKLIYNRGHRDAVAARDFLDSSLDCLCDPDLMKDMDKALERIDRALMNNEKITVYGDYDVDGVTSVTLIYLYLKSLGADIDYYIPSRSREGYGLSVMALDRLKEEGTQLIITVDTGITANYEAEYARQNGMEMIITDHHECHEVLPDACAVVNPHRPDCAYPFKELAGVGVVFKLVCAYELHRCPDQEKKLCIENICKEYIDLVAIGTVADVMPLVSENRVIVKYGLRAIAETKRCGLAALMDAASSTGSNSRIAVGEKNTVKKKKINAGYIGFTLAPRINAAGRISSAEKAVALLLSEDNNEAAVMAEELCEINTRRQLEENVIADQAYKMIEEKHDFSKDKVIVLDENIWQQGIIGIVSSRITEKYGLPSILISFDGSVKDYETPDDLGKGSGRSVKGMNLVEALDYCKELLVRFGGHELAAGLSIKRCHIDAFREKINEYARERLIDDLSVVKYEADCELSSDEINMELAEEIAVLEPYGVANQSPLFLVRDLTLDKIISMGGGKHSKILLSLDGKKIQAVFFNMPASLLEYYPGEKIDLLCQLNTNEFRGQINLQLVVQDIRLSESYQNAYNTEKNRYCEIADGAEFDADEGIIPSRADIAELYRLLRYENTCGNTAFTYRMLRSMIEEHSGKNVRYAKLRFAMSILDDIKVCHISHNGDGLVSVEICANAEKTNIEFSETYKRLTRQLHA